MVEDRIWRCLYQSATVVIGDYRCRAATIDCGGEEFSTRHEIVFIRSGAFVKHIRGLNVVADPNQTLLFNRGEPYRVSHPVPGGDTCTTFALGQDSLLDLLKEHDPGVVDRPETPFLVTHGPCEPECFWLHRRLLQTMAWAHWERLALEESVMDLLASALRFAIRPPPKRRIPIRPGTARFQREQVDATKLLIAKHLGKRLELGQIARAVHSSPYHLCRLFKRETGMAIHQYLNRIRLRASLDRLPDVSRELTRIALELGYYDLSHFSNAFREEFSMSPSKFRRSCTSRQLAEMSKKFQA